MTKGFPYLDEHTYFPFPSVNEATEEGIVAHGGNLSPGMLLSAYRQGIFPWFSEHEPILWWSPDPRFVLIPEKLRVSRSMRKVLRQQQFTLTLDRNFPAVISACSNVPRRGQEGTWITPAMQEAYIRMHELGYAHSVEAWQYGELVGGLYGFSLGSCFFGESMFSRVSNASKAAFILLVWFLMDHGFTLIDSQVYTPHLASLGAEDIPRSRYLQLLSAALENKTCRGDWAEEFSHFPVSSRYRQLLSRS